MAYAAAVKRILIVAAILVGLQAIAVAIWLAVQPSDPPMVEHPNGRLVELPDDRPILLHFWATWCPPCREELPDLLALGRRLLNRGGPELWAVTLDTDWAIVSAFFDGTLPEAIWRAPNGLLAERYRVETLPVTLLLASDGTVLRRYDGLQRWRDLEAEIMVTTKSP